METDLLVVCVLDMDETLGVYDHRTFHVRPKIQTLINLIRLMKGDIILWSLGSNEYVKRVVSVSLPDIKRYAYKLFAHSECQRSMERYGFYKASEHIRIMYDCDIFLIAVDDKVSQNMDPNYDMRIHVRPYSEPKSNDKAMLEVCEKIIQGVMTARDLKNNGASDTRAEGSEDYIENVWLY